MKKNEKNGIIAPESVVNDIFQFFPLDDHGKPIEIEYALGVMDNKRLPQKIELLDVLYIDLKYENREEIAIYLSKPIKKDGKVFEMVRWNKRLTGEEVLDKLGDDFIRISDHYIVQKYSIIALNKEKGMLTVRDRNFAQCIDSYQTKELKYGDTYLSEIMKSGVFNLVKLTNTKAPVCEDYHHISKSSILINPIKIALIEISGENKTITLDNSFGDEALQPVRLVWKTQKSINTIIKDFGIDSFVQVHKSFLVNLHTLLKSPRLKGGNLILQLNVLKEPKAIEVTIPVGRHYKKEVEVLLADINYNELGKLLFLLYDYNVKKTDSLLLDHKKGKVRFEFLPDDELLVDEKWEYLGPTHKGIMYLVLLG